MGWEPCGPCGRFAALFVLITTHLYGALYSQALEVGGEGVVLPILQRGKLILAKAKPLA